MRIVMLSQWYLPEPDIKVHLLAKDLLERGHQVTSITGFPNYPQGRIYPGYRQHLWQWEDMDRVPVLRLPLYPDHSGSAVRRGMNYFSFAASAAMLGPIMSGPTDVIWVYHPPLTVGIPAWWIGLLRRAPFIFNIHDMWPETLAATGMMPSKKVARMVGWMAALIYQRAAAITVISEGFKRNLIGKGVPADKIYVVPNWADEEVYRPVEPDGALAAEYGLSGRFNVVYGGNLGAAQAMRNVLAAAALLGDLPNVQFVLIGDGMEAESLKTVAREQRLTNVRFIPQQPAARMPQFFALADALLIHLKRDPLFEITVPGKTTAYLACGRPIICAVSGDTAIMVKDANAGVVCWPEDPIGLAQAVREMYALTPAQRHEMGSLGRRSFLAHYTRAVLTNRYESLLQSVAEKKAGE
jgi:colanic acid biosynthesis glycosyl transferase WcaI